MIIKPKTRGFICTTSHPAGCAAHVKEQIKYVNTQPLIENGPKKVLIIGSSTGYGLASRIVATFTSGADTIGVFFEKSSSGNRTASAGWYNTAAFEQLATENGRVALSINGDAFSDAIKKQTIDKIKEHLGFIDLVIYSLASPRRVHPQTGEVFASTLKTIGTPYVNKTIDPATGIISEVTIPPASTDEINATVNVMGGEDWLLWIKALQLAGVLATGFKTVAYSYIGPEITYPLYREGTIGKAKEHLEATVNEINQCLNSVQGKAWVSINKAVVTQASAAIPVVPLYISILFKVMKAKGIHEGCIEQIYRLFKDELYNSQQLPRTDNKGRIRIDDLEMRNDVQEAITEAWNHVNSETLSTIADLEGYKQDFLQLFGFEITGVDYDQDINPQVAIASIDEQATAAELM